MIELVLRVTIVICIVIDVTGQSVTGPSNTVALVGTTVTLYCSTSVAASFVWAYTSVQGITSPACFCGSTCTPSYLNTTVTTTSCSLTISAAQGLLNVAGVYQCTSSVGSPQSAQLIILGSNPVCTTNTSSNSIIVGQSASMSCTVNYSATANTYSPSMTWTGQPPIVPINSISSTMVSSILNVATSSANIPYVPPYNCTTQMINLAPPGLNYATNIPLYTNIYTSPPFMVLYAPFANNISFTGSDLLLEGPQLEQASIDSTLSCSAVAYTGSTFTYMWTSPNGSNSSGSTITLSYLGSNLTYWCSATNAIGSGSNYITVTVTTTIITTTKTTTTKTMTTKTTTTTPTPTRTTTQIPAVVLTSVPLGLIIGFCVGIPVVIIGVILMCCFYRRCPYYHKVSCCNAQPRNVNVKVIYEDLQIPRECDQSESRMYTDVALTSDRQEDHTYENTLVQTRPQQDVSTSHYQELIKDTTTNSGIQQDSEHTYQDLIRT